MQLNKCDLYKSSLMDLKTPPDNAEGNKAQAGNAVQRERSKREDAMDNKIEHYGKQIVLTEKNRDAVL